MLCATNGGAGSGEELMRAADAAVGVNRGLCAGGIPAKDFLEKALGREAPLKAYVDASARHAAALKGASRKVWYLSKTQGVELFWLRDVVRAVPKDLCKVASIDNVADAFTKGLSGSRTEGLRQKIGMS